MTSVLIVAIPVVFILAIALALKLKSPFHDLLIVVLAVCSTFVVDFVFCSVLSPQCEPVALKAVAYIVHPFLVIVVTAILYDLLSKRAFLR